MQNTRYLITEQKVDADDLLNIAACAVTEVCAAHPNPIRLQEKDGRRSLSCRVGGCRAVNRNADLIRSVSSHEPYVCYMMSASTWKPQGCCVRSRRTAFCHNPARQGLATPSSTMKSMRFNCVRVGLFARCLENVDPTLRRQETRSEAGADFFSAQTVDSCSLSMTVTRADLFSLSPMSSSAASATVVVFMLLIFGIPKKHGMKPVEQHESLI